MSVHRPGKTVFGLLKRGGFRENRQRLLKRGAITGYSGKILEKPVIYTDSWKAYDGLILNGYDHSENEFVRGKNHVNGIENVQTAFVLELCEAAAFKI